LIYIPCVLGRSADLAVCYRYRKVITQREREKLFHHVGTLYLKQTNLYIYICIFVAICDVLVLYDIALLLINIIPELQTTILFL